ncbi:hypothetical protein KVR01_008976 [Diaporthe batatas]|uniref:uncharacterized protein n=1 Tax=Diaporthe batatas TaxID=748121 RepID=UPI001D0385A2|nr:uncharacterized protein KVR01_008976 [Diaporthe batatas]KAG8160712.1 hypothetical protein KVR01_008976 [Diaporthe batatas]
MASSPVPGDTSSSPGDVTTKDGPSIAEETVTPAATPASGSPRLAFWVIISVLCTCSLVSSLDALIITTALPYITSAIGGHAQYVWVANSFVLASTAVQPLYAQLSNIFGRRNPMLIAITLFTLGSGICGGARNIAMLIAGRTVQGLGSAGLFVLADLIVCDLVPLRDRAKYMGIADWRWCFYINLPLAIPALATMVVFLRLRHQREPTWKNAVKRVDFLGALIFIPSMTALLLGLVMGGTVFPWHTYHIIVPIVLGVVGWVVFHVHQASPICKEPSVPPQLFQNRTSATGYVLTFLSALVLNWVTYFLPFYFMAVKLESPLIAGVYVLPYSLFMVPSAMAAGVLLSKLGQYKPLHWAGFALTAIACGLLSILDAGSSKAAWVCFQIIVAIGLGLILTTILPAICAPLGEEYVATANGTFSFLRSFGFVWGITLPSIIFNDRFDHFAGRISDAGVRSQLTNGAAYSYASSSLIGSLTGSLRNEVISVYTDALRSVWLGAVGFAAFGFFLVFVEKHIALRTDLETNFGLEEKPAGQNVAKQAKDAQTMSDSA